MKNLTGVQVADALIEEELRLAMIPACWCLDQNGEVPATIIGKLGGFTFTRAWTYWVVKGDVPLDVAREIYADPIGEDSVRVRGHIGKISPDTGVTYDNDGPVIRVYHIDTQEGLRLFADIIKRHGIVWGKEGGK